MLDPIPRCTRCGMQIPDAAHAFLHAHTHTPAVAGWSAFQVPFALFPVVAQLMQSYAETANDPAREIALAAQKINRTLDEFDGDYHAVDPEVWDHFWGLVAAFPPPADAP